MRALEPLTAVGIGIAIFNEIFTLQLTVRLRILLYAKPVNTETKNISRARDLQGWSKGGGIILFSSSRVKYSGSAFGRSGEYPSKRS